MTDSNPEHGITISKGDMPPKKDKEKKDITG